MVNIVDTRNGVEMHLPSDSELNWVASSSLIVLRAVHYRHGAARSIYLYANVALIS